MIFEIEKEILPEHLSPEILEQPLPDGERLVTQVSLDCLTIPESGISIEEVEHALVKKALEIAGGNQTRASQLLKMPRDAFRRRMKRFGLV
jgi:DNA-binding NtrC family response regulator